MTLTVRTLFLFVVIVALGGFAWWDHTKLIAVTQERDALQTQLNSLNARPVAKPSTGSRILCPLCKGEGAVVYDSTGSGKLTDRRTQPCPVCLGKGYRMLVVPAGKKLCPDCHGMGIVYYPEQPGHPIRSANCARCGAIGLVADIH